MDEKMFEENIVEETQQEVVREQLSAVEVENEQLKHRIAALENYSRETVKNHRSDKIASGVVGALLGALFALVIMIPFVFMIKEEAKQPSGDGQNLLVSDENSPFYGLNTDKLQEILKNLDDYFLYDKSIDPEKVEAAMLQGLMAGLGDDYAYYYNEEEYKELQESNEGEYYGIGVQVSQNIETMVITVAHVFRNSPAMEAGMLEGDIIVGVAGQDIRQMNIDDVVGLIKGEAGSKVEIVVFRPSLNENVTLQVERRKVEQDFVYWEMLEDNIGYIELIQFAGNAAGQFKLALKELNAQGMEGLVLDLRGNPGGLLDSVVDIAGQLLPGGVVLTVKSNFTADEVHRVKDSGFKTPLVVLVNEYSASASEVLSGAIQDYGVGTLVGTTTYGKGIVQWILPLKDGKTGVKFTIADYYTPNGRNIHGIGIEPDVNVEMNLEGSTDNQLEKALEVLKEKMNP